MEFYSKKLAKNIELGIAGGADDILLIDSRSLGAFMDNDKDVRDKGFSVVIDQTNVITSPDLSSIIIFGYAQDNEHTYSLECGEARAESLTNDISQAYPAKMALKRLKDVCAINWLELEGAEGKRIYSSDEIPELRDKTSLKTTEAKTTTATDDELAAIINGTSETEVEETPATTLEAYDSELAALIENTVPVNEEIASEPSMAAEIPEEVVSTTVEDVEEIEKLLDKTFTLKGKKHTYKDVLSDDQLKGWFLKTQFKTGQYAKIKENLIKILKARGEEF